MSVVGPTPVRADGLTLRLKWDFRTSFPAATEQAIDAGLISDEDTSPENIRSIHEEHTREMLATLHDLDVVLDARRRGVDPRNNKAPMLEQARDRLRKFFDTEPARLEQWYANLLGAYADAFGNEAASEFDKAVRAWHAGVEVVGESGLKLTLGTGSTQPALVRTKAKRNPLRMIARLPVPRPLPSAIAAGHFGHEENGKPVNPRAREVREITELHAEKLIDLLDSIALAPVTTKNDLWSQFSAGIAAYAEDFGQRAAEQLDAYVRRQAGLDPASRRER